MANVVFEVTTLTYLCYFVLPIYTTLLNIKCENVNVSSCEILNKSKHQTTLLRNQQLGNESLLDIGYRIAREENVQNDSLNILNKHRELLENFKQTWPLQRWRYYGIFTDDYLKLLNEHWLQFPPPPECVHYALGGIYIIFVIIGISGNILVLFMYSRCRSLRTPGNVLVANLALSDFVMLAEIPIFIFNSFNLGPALGNPGCVIYGFIGGLTGTTSIATLAAIALDRYWAVVRPLEPLRSLTVIRARFMAVGAWIYAAIFSSIPALDIGYGRYVPEGYLTSCSFDYLTDELPPRYFIFAFFCAAWVVPFSTIFFCYLKILFVVIFQRNITLRNQEHRLSSRHIKEQVKRKAEVKLAILVIIVIVLFFVSWTPYAIVALIGIFGKKELITPTASMIPALFCKTAACINPFIYIISHPKFRKEFNKLIKSKRSGSFMDRSTKDTYCIEINKGQRSGSKDIDSTDVEELEIKDIPYATPQHTKNRIKTVAATVAEPGVLQQCDKVACVDNDILPPPSWYVKPKFSKRQSLRKF